MSLNYPHANIKKMVCSKNIWVPQGYSGTHWDEEIKDLLKREGMKEGGIFI